MNTSKQNRRQRIKRPLTLIIISMVLILSPLYNYILQLQIRSMSIRIANLQYLKFSLLEYFFIFIPVVCGIGLYLIKKWGWYLFILYSIIIISFNLFAVIKLPTTFNFYSLFEAFLVFVSVVYFLKKDISAPYFKTFSIENKLDLKNQFQIHRSKTFKNKIFKILYNIYNLFRSKARLLISIERGWRGEQRKNIHKNVSINNQTYITKDFSENGFYIQVSNSNYNINEEVKVELEFEKIKKIFFGGVVREDGEGVGIAFRRLTIEDRSWLKTFLKSEA